MFARDAGSGARLRGTRPLAIPADRRRPPGDRPHERRADARRADGLSYEHAPQRGGADSGGADGGSWPFRARAAGRALPEARRRSEEHTSELQSLAYLVCRLLLEKKKK